MKPHNLTHAIYGCRCERSEIDRCVICGKRIDCSRPPYVDTCGRRCFRTLLRKQREAPPLPEAERRERSAPGPVIYPTHTCFDDALEFLVLGELHSVQRKRLVHGICLADDDSPYAHAWVELDGDAWQGGLLDGERIYYAMPIAELHERLRVRECTRYAALQAMRQNVATGHYGPWEPKYRELTSDDRRTWTARPPKATRSEQNAPASWLAKEDEP